MRRVIYRYPVQQNEQNLFFKDIPRGKVVLFAQRGLTDLGPTLWVEHSDADLEDTKDTRSYLVYGTGHAIGERVEHIASCVCAVPGGSLVWHLYGPHR